ncbi:MAG: NUDIX domain-containing protein [Erysipelotrichaceae bacterium]|jgi:ADP-ribose pyrophosphatase YjhB (NUDIX family)/DNA-binding XRE family transcriptional regulator|nr:NUDIX domain-containing protein [Erysipelotrichaceae bacterium]
MSVHFGKKIKEIRKKNNLTQLEFAQIFGYKDKSMIAHIEKGETEMSNDKIALLIDKFNIDANELFLEKKIYDDKNYVKRIRKYLGDQKIILNCAGGIVEKDGKILFQRRTDNDKWGLPGGLLELNETYLEAAIREIKEETGLDVRPKYFLGIFHNHNMVWGNGDKAHTIGAYYVFEIEGGDLKIDEESSELKFCSKEEVPPLFAPDHIKAVEAYYKGIKNTIFEA